MKNTILVLLFMMIGSSVSHALTLKSLAKIDYDSAISQTEMEMQERTYSDFKVDKSEVHFRGETRFKDSHVYKIKRSAQFDSSNRTEQGYLD